MESNSFDHGSDSNSCSEYSLDFQETESSLSSLRALDDTLRCRICFDYFKNCAVTKCSHNYCSVCIRRYMSKKAQCPLCFEEAFESDLRDNKTIDEILRIYSSIKGNLPSCAKDVDPHSDDHPQPPMVQIKREVTDNIPQNEVAESTKETEQEKEWDDVSCPVCFKVTSSQHINTHLEHCPKSRNKDTSRNTLVLRSYCKECTKEECSVYIPPSDERKYMCAFCGCYPTKHLKVDRLKLPTEVDITDSEDCISPIRTVPIVQQTPSVPPCGVNLEACVAPVTVHLENLHSSPSHIHVELGTSNSQDNTLQEQSTKRKRRLPARFRFSSGDDDESSLSLSKRLLGQSFSPEFNELEAKLKNMLNEKSMRILRVFSKIKDVAGASDSIKKLMEEATSINNENPFVSGISKGIKFSCAIADEQGEEHSPILSIELNSLTERCETAEIKYQELLQQHEKCHHLVKSLQQNVDCLTAERNSISDLNVMLQGKLLEETNKNNLHPKQSPGSNWHYRGARQDIDNENVSWELIDDGKISPKEQLDRSELEQIGGQCVTDMDVAVCSVEPTCEEKNVPQFSKKIYGRLLTPRQLKKLCTVREGQDGDSQFVKLLASFIWTPRELANRSAAGFACTTKRGEKARKECSPKKKECMRDFLRNRILQSKIPPTDEEVNTRMSSFNKYLSSKITTVRRDLQIK